MTSFNRVRKANLHTVENKPPGSSAVGGMLFPGPMDSRGMSQARETVLKRFWDLKRLFLTHSSLTPSFQYFIESFTVFFTEHVSIVYTLESSS